MTIVINSTGLGQSAGNDFFYDYFIKFAAFKPDDRFIFVSPSATDHPPVAAKNIVHVISMPVGNNILMWKTWLDYTLIRIARKHRADLLIHTGGLASLRSRIPQCLFISDLSFLNFPRFFSKQQLYFLKKNMPAWLRKANTIVAGSAFLAKEIRQYFSIDEKKITPIQLVAADDYQPIGWEEKEIAREKYAEGKEYFLFSGEINPRNNLVNLLKAFSIFKIRQKSNMQLIITTRTSSTNDPFIETIKTYKYRKEVKILAGLREKDLAKITAAAYAFLYPAMYEGMAIFTLQAMQCGVPVITCNTGALCEIAGDAVLYADPESPEDIAGKMMLVFKDENRRSALIKKALLIIQKNKEYYIDERWWNSILSSIPQENNGLSA